VVEAYWYCKRASIGDINTWEFTILHDPVIDLDLGLDLEAKFSGLGVGLGLIITVVDWTVACSPALVTCVSLALTVTLSQAKTAMATLKYLHFSIFKKCTPSFFNITGRHQWLFSIT